MFGTFVTISRLHQAFHSNHGCICNAIGDILSQGTIGMDLSIAYTSRLLNKAKQNYSIIEKSLLAIVYNV